MVKPRIGARENGLGRLSRGIFLGLAITLVLPLPAGAQTELTSKTYKVDSLNFGTNNALSSSRDGIPPAITSEGPSVINLTPNSATIKWKTDKESTSVVEYGTTNNLGSQVGLTTRIKEHTVKITGLAEQTTYYYKVVSVDAFDGKGVSGIKSVTTPAKEQIQEVSVSDVTYTTALIRVKSGGVTSVRVNFGTSTTYGSAQEAATVTSVVETNFPLTGLDPGVKYFLQVLAKDAKDNSYEVSGLTLTTIDEPEFVSATAGSNDPNQATVLATTNTETSLLVTYKSEKEKEELTAGDPDFATTHTLILAKLEGTTTYRLKVVARDKQGKEVGTDLKVTTAVDTRAPNPSDPRVTVNREGGKITVILSVDVDEPVKTKVTATSKVNQESVVEGGLSEFTPKPRVIMSGFSDGTPYEFVLRFTDRSDNSAEKEVTVVTPKKLRRIFDLILANLKPVLGPIEKLLEAVRRGRP